MAWTAPRNWAAISGGIVTAASLNTDVRDNLGVLSTHTHTGAAGFGASSMTGLTLAALVTLTFADQSANPDAAGELQRNGNDILWYGSSVVNLSAADASAGTASLRSLGTTSAKAAAGNHTHTDIQNFTSNGTWTKPAGAERVMVELLAGGGGGEGNTSGTGTADNGGAGGGGGGRTVYMFDADDLSGTEAIVIGAGGAAGASGSGGSTGSLSSFAAGTSYPLVASGGVGGNTSGGAGGEGYGGDGGNLSGGAGNVSTASGGGGGGGARETSPGSYGSAGAGGVSQDGGNGGAGGANGAAGSAGIAPSGGGGGASGSQTNRAGGAGAAGKARVVTYLNMTLPAVPF